MSGRGQTVKVAGRTLKVSNLDKVLYPQTGTTKSDVLDYLLRVAPALLPHAQWRPATRKRWVNGVGTAEEPGKVFFRKDLEDSAPSWIPRAELKHKTHSNTYPLANDEAVLAWFGQVAALEIHVPQWRLDASLTPQNPDRLVLDLDPGPGLELSQCAEVAFFCKEILEGMDLESFPVTSGSKGIHLYAPLDGKSTSEQVNAVAKELALTLEREHPDLVVAKMQRSLREGKVLVDWSQNNASKTTVCPYSLRGKARPTVAAPRTWEEIGSPGLAQLDFHEVLDRLADGLDPLHALASGAIPATDKLAVYRSKRDAALTPEPVPEADQESRRDKGSSSSESSFVIQEHHARRLHWDFRLEHEGVLVSWAVPKGPPLEHGVQRLAVMTEDHPLSYGSFEGTIPKGQYGAGEVTIWDSGSCVIEKWREGQEVIAVLTGEAKGGLGGEPRRFVLFQAKGMDGKDNWLLQLAKEQPEEAQELKPSSALDPVPQPMLAKLGSERDINAQEPWSFEMKWDGYRAIARIKDGKTELYSRNGNRLDSDFPQLQELAELLDEGSVVDGEIVAVDSTGKPSFSLLQRSLSKKPKKGQKPARPGTIQYMVFDVLRLKDKNGSKLLSLTDMTYVERRKYLTSRLLDGKAIKVPPAHDGTLADALSISQELGLEGIVAKLEDSTYEAGKRSGSWIKIKHEQHQEVVVIGWREGQGERKQTLGSLLLAVPENGSLRFAGRVGTGFSTRQLAEARKILSRIERKTPAVKDIPNEFRRDAHWVTPKYVAEVRYSELTSDRHLRHPVWRGWREDKSPEEISWETINGKGKQ